MSRTITEEEEQAAWAAEVMQREADAVAGRSEHYDWREALATVLSVAADS